jgi:hypothetical protein
MAATALFFTTVTLGAADPAVFVSARSEATSGSKVLAREAALRLGELRRLALVETAPYTKAQVAYLGALSTLLAHDVFTADAAALSYSTEAGTRKHGSLVAEYAILALSLASQLEAQGAHLELVSLLHAANEAAKHGLSGTSVWSARLRQQACFANGAVDWDGSVEVARIAYVLATTPPKTDDLRVRAASRLRDLHDQLANARCGEQAMLLEREVAENLLRDVESKEDATLVPVRVRIHRFLGHADEALAILGREASTASGLLALNQEPLEASAHKVRQYMRDMFSIGGEDAWPPLTVRALTTPLPLPVPTIAILVASEGVGLPSIARALELRGNAAAEKDTEAVAVIEAWLTKQGYVLKHDNARSFLVAAGMLDQKQPTALQRVVDFASAIKQRLAPPPLVWPPPANNLAEWWPRPASSDEWRTLLPADAATRHAQLRAMGHKRGEWLRLGMPADLMPAAKPKNKNKEAAVPAQTSVRSIGLRDFLS